MIEISEERWLALGGGWTCKCGLQMVGPERDGLCAACQKEADRARQAAKPMGQVLAGVTAYGKGFDPKRVHVDHDGIKPEQLHAGKKLSTWRGGVVLLHGEVGAGKSRLAAWMLYRCHALGLVDPGKLTDASRGKALAWITHAQLVGDSFNPIRDWIAKPDDRAADALVVDDIFADDLATSRGINVLHELLEQRLPRPATILTSHLPFQADFRLPPSEASPSIQFLAPSVYDRIMDGWAVPLLGDSQRGLP